MSEILIGSRVNDSLTWSGKVLPSDPSSRRGDLTVVDFSSGSGMIMVGIERCACVCEGMSSKRENLRSGACLLCCVNALRGSPAERRLMKAQQAPDSFSPPQSATPPIGPLRTQASGLRACCELAASAQQY
jgi:hypothetical protein